MIKVTRPQLWSFLQNIDDTDETYGEYISKLDADQPTEQAITRELFTVLRNAMHDGDLNSIMTDFEISEQRHGGDVFAALADDVAEAVENHHAIVTWYGGASEVLIASYNCDVISIVD